MNRPWFTAVIAALLVAFAAPHAGAATIFAAPLSFDTGHAPGFVAVGDLNGDGKPDFVVVNEGSNPSFSSTVSVLLGNGDGTYGPRTDYGVGNLPTSVVWLPVSIGFPPFDLQARPVKPFPEPYREVDSLRVPTRGPLLIDAETVGFSVDLVPRDSVVVGRALEVGVLVSGYEGTGAVANVRLATQGGLVLADEDTSFSAPLVGSVPLHPVRLRPRGSGEGVLRERATVVRNGVEQVVAEVALPVRVRGDTLVAGSRSYYRSEFIVNGQRYRVSGPWCVPIDSPEEIDPADVLAPTTQPGVLRQKVAICRDCDASVKRVELLVVVDASGAVRQMLVVGGPASPAAEQSAVNAVRRWWAFRPGRVGDTPVTDCLRVSVPIRPERR